MTELLSFQTPATSANLGPGYGVLGLALDLSLTTTLEPTDDGNVAVDRRDDPDANDLDPRHDTVLRGLRAAAELLQVDLSRGLRLVVEGAVPRGAGLGTNSAGFAAGIGAAVRLASKPCSPGPLIDTLVSLGGDPAHGAASLMGGLVAAALISKPQELPRHHLVPQGLSADWRYILVLPDLQMGTAETTRVLPATLPHAVIKRNTGRLVGLLDALAKGDEELLGACLFDEVHVPFRRKLVPGLEQALTAGREVGAAGVTISGHGPGVLAFTTDETKAESIGTAMADVFREHSVPATMMSLRANTTGSLPRDGETAGNTETPPE